MAVLPINFFEQIIKSQNDHMNALTNQLQQQSEPMGNVPELQT